MNLQQNTYDQYADEYAAMLQKWAQDGSLYHDLVIPQVLEFLGDVAGRTIWASITFIAPLRST